MSQQPSPTSPIDTTEEAKFGGINLLIGFVIGFALQFGWWALLDRLSLRTVDPGNDGFFAQLLAAIGQSRTAGFIIGAMLGATNNSTSSPIRAVVWKSICWAIGFSLIFFSLEVMRFVLQTVLGESLGDIVSSALWLGLVGAFAGIVMELQRTVAPHIGSAVLSFRQIAQWTLKFDGAAVRRVLVVTLLGALLGITIETLFQELNAWPFMLVLDAVVAAVAIRMWRPSSQTLRKWAVGALTLFIIIGLLLLLDISAQLGVLAGIVVLVGYAILQSRK